MSCSQCQCATCGGVGAYQRIGANNVHADPEPCGDCQAGNDMMKERIEELEASAKDLARKYHRAVERADAAEKRAEEAEHDGIVQHAQQVENVRKQLREARAHAERLEELIVAAMAVWEHRPYSRREHRAAAVADAYERLSDGEVAA